MRMYLCAIMVVLGVMVSGTVSTAYAQETTENIRETHSILTEIATPITDTLAEIKSNTDALWNLISSMLGETAAIHTDTEFIKQEITANTNTMKAKQLDIEEGVTELKESIDLLQDATFEKTTNDKILGDINSFSNGMTSKITELEVRVDLLIEQYGTKTASSNVEQITTGSIIINQPKSQNVGGILNVVSPAHAERYVIDGDSIMLQGITYNLAFVNTPELGESGARDAIKRMEELCIDNSVTIYVTPAESVNAEMQETDALIVCDTEFVNRILLEENLGEYNQEHCSVRSFVGVLDWVDDLCEGKITI